MAKARATMFFCKECGYESAKWMGQCPGCKEWNSFVEEPVAKKSTGSRAVALKESKPVRISEVDFGQEERYSSGFGELDRVLGGGIVRGSMVLVGGDPGIGKSTILLQVCRNLSKERKVIYISGEESLSQIKMRADRIGEMPDDFYLMCETNLSLIDSSIRSEKPDVVIIDSIQTMFTENSDSAPGSVSQVREITARIMKMCKQKAITTIIIGHVTKDGNIAGPRVLEHMVDTVLYLEGERYFSYRILRGVKNRFGSTNEVGMFEMQSEGMMEITNPSSILISEREDNPSRKCYSCKYGRNKTTFN